MIAVHGVEARAALKALNEVVAAFMFPTIALKPVEQSSIAVRKAVMSFRPTPTVAKNTFSAVLTAITASL